MTVTRIGAIHRLPALVGFVVQVATMAAAGRVHGVHYLLATAVAVELAIVANFLWHERWTWQDGPRAK